jgi:hypothetical protein
MRTGTQIQIVAMLVLAFAAASCSRALAPTSTGHSSARTGMSDADLTFDPLPPQPADIPDGTGSLTPAASPSATITVPRPNHLLVPTLPPTFTVQWSPNVPAPGGPVPTRYRYRLFSEFDPEFDFIQLLVDPQSMLRFYAPGFAGWTEVAGDVTQATVQDLTPSEKHVFVVIALDDHGHFDGVLSFDRNALVFNVSLAAAANVEDTQELPSGR